MKTSLNTFVIETDGVTSTLTIHSSRFSKFSCLWQESKIPGAFYLFALAKHRNRNEETWVQAPVLIEASWDFREVTYTPGFPVSSSVKGKKLGYRVPKFFPALKFCHSLNAFTRETHCPYQKSKYKSSIWTEVLYLL